MDIKVEEKLVVAEGCQRQAEATKAEPIFEGVDINALVEAALKRKDGVATLLSTQPAIVAAPPSTQLAPVPQPTVTKSEPLQQKTEEPPKPQKDAFEAKVDELEALLRKKVSSRACIWSTRR